MEKTALNKLDHKPDAQKYRSRQDHHLQNEKDRDQGDDFRVRI